jgi:hypothetical protein
VTAAYWKARVLAAAGDPAALEVLALELAGLARRAELDTPSVSPVTFAVPPEGAGFAFGPTPGVVKTFDRIEVLSDLPGSGCDTGDETTRPVLFEMRPGRSVTLTADWKPGDFKQG